MIPKFLLHTFSFHDPSGGGMPSAAEVNWQGQVDVRGHAAVMDVALNERVFSSDVSRFLQVPNGLDGRWHTAFRMLVDRYMTPEKVADLRAETEQIARQVVQDALNKGTVDAVEVGAQFAVRASSQWLGWPESLQAELLDWVQANWAATASGQLERTREVAQWYNRIITGLLADRRQHPTDDVTSQLMNDTSLGRPLTEEEIVSILRNWTGGDLGSMALCVGVTAAYLADHPDLQAHLRAGASDAEWKAVLDEVLRLDDPFLASRRVCTRPTFVGGVEVEQGQRVNLDWHGANTDPQVFGDNQFDPAGNADKNLVWGIGRHVCPGRDLATMQFQAIVRALLQETSLIEGGDAPRGRSTPPAGGYSAVPVRLHPAAATSPRGRQQ